MDLETNGKKYQIIYADPPWSYEQFQGKGEKYGDVSSHYDTLTISELKKIPIDNIADNDCALFMWATYPNLPQAIELMDAWKFQYKTVAFTWIKKNKNGGFYSGLGFYTNSNCEICLLGIRGRLNRINKDVKQIVVSPLREHSRKPDEVRNRIERLYGTRLNRIELFARNRVDGWDCYGNQLSDTIQKRLM